MDTQFSNILNTMQIMTIVSVVIFFTIFIGMTIMVIVKQLKGQSKNQDFYDNVKEELNKSTTTESDKAPTAVIKCRYCGSKIKKEHDRCNNCGAVN